MKTTLVAIALFLAGLQPACAQDQAPRLNKPLQGGVDQTFIPTEVQDNTLQGGADQWGGQLNNQQGSMDQGQPLNGGIQDNALNAGIQGNAPLQGGASEDPDFDNADLTIEWDRWRNELQQAIQAGTLANINVHNNIHFVWDPRTQMMQSRYPNGTSVWYSLQVLPNRKIINLRLSQRSQFPSYDQAVIQAINDLQGKKLLTYPKGSKRKIVSQEANVSTAPQSSFTNFNFGDVERQRN